MSSVVTLGEIFNYHQGRCEDCPEHMTTTEADFNTCRMSNLCSIMGAKTNYLFSSTAIKETMKAKEIPEIS